MRNSAKIIFIIVLVAFVGFMVWGGVVTILSSKNTGAGGAPPGVVGIINGKQIPYEQFYEIYSVKSQSLYKDDKEPTDEDFQRVSDEVWNSLTTYVLIEQEAGAHGIAVTDKEVSQYMRQSPPKDIYESPDFATDGNFDMSKYQMWLQQVAMSNDPRLIQMLRDFENQIRQQLLVGRLQDFVLSAIRFTKNDARTDFVEKNDKVKVKYIFIPGGDFDSVVTEVPEDEILSRYEKDKEQFKQPDRAVITHVTFSKQPSDEDYAELKASADQLYKEAISGADFAKLAEENSDDKNSAAKAGDIGWFSEGAMVAPFYEATKNIRNVGDISQPIKTQFGWHIIKLTGRREKGGSSLVSTSGGMEYMASHILLKVEASQNTITAIEQKANDFKNQAVKNGFKVTAEEYGLTSTESKPFNKGTYVPGVGQNAAVNDLAFNAEIGTISDPIPTRSAVMVVEVTKKIPAGYSPLDEVRDRIKTTILREKRVVLAHKKGEELAGQLTAGISFEDFAARIGKPIIETDFITRSQFVPKVGNDPEFSGAAFSLSYSNPVSKAVKSKTGTFIIKFMERQNPDLAIFESKADSLTYEMANTKRKDLWSRYISNVREKAEIKDYRS